MKGGASNITHKEVIKALMLDYLAPSHKEVASIPISVHQEKNELYEVP